MIEIHMISVVVGFILDMIFGDPYWMPHPIRLIGNTISFLEKKLNKENDKDKIRLLKGLLMVIIVVGLTMAISGGIIFLAYSYAPWYVTIVVESIMIYQILATKCLKVESMKVYDQLEKGDVEAARKAVSMIVGRDTECLDDIGITKAAVETVAENTSDGSIAPLIYVIIGGPVLGFMYKAINTMDSMVGYKNDRFMFFGRAAAKLDDVVNYIPSRISAYLMILSCAFLGKEYDTKNAWRMHKRDSRKHASPNSAQTESTAAGALNIRLAGDASYFGKIHKKPFIGDDVRPVEYQDIKRANRLLYMTAVLCLIVGLSLYEIVILLYYCLQAGCIK